MSKQLYVISTLTNDNEYCEYGPLIPGAARQPVRSVLIKGKAGLPNTHLWTPRGVVTPITSEEEALLRDNDLFKLHEEGGWVTVENMDPRDADKAAADQNERDGSSLLTKEEIEAKAPSGKVKAKGA